MRRNRLRINPQAKSQSQLKQANSEEYLVRFSVLDLLSLGIYSKATRRQFPN